MIKIMWFLIILLDLSFSVWLINVEKKCMTLAEGQIYTQEELSLDDEKLYVGDKPHLFAEFLHH